MSVVAVVAISLIAGAVFITVKQWKPELALPLGIACGCIILGALLAPLSGIIGEIKSIMEKSGIASEYIKIMLKALGISYLVSFATEACDDFGLSSLSSKVELCGKIAIAVLTLPLVVSYLEALNGIMN